MCVRARVLARDIPVLVQVYVPVFVQVYVRVLVQVYVRVLVRMYVYVHVRVCQTEKEYLTASMFL